MTLKNKSIIITGASQGLGKTLAEKCAKEGAQVIMIARSENLLKEIKTTIKNDNGKAEYYVCDIADLSCVQKTVKDIFKKCNQVDILVNNAGVFLDNEIEKKNPEKRKQAFAINAVGNIQFTQEVLPFFQNRNKGYIFNVVSTSGAIGIPEADNKFWQTYGATKWAFAGFTKSLRSELHNTNIKVTGFFPGGFDSNLYENAKLSHAHQQPWMMQTKDIADIIVFALTRPEDVLMEEIIVTKMMPH